MAKRADQLGLKQTNVTMFSSMAHTQDQFVMVNVKAIEPAFPLRGKLEIEPIARGIQPGEVWLSQRAADLLKVKLGDMVSIADAAFRFSGVIVRDSNQELGFSGFRLLSLFIKQILLKLMQFKLVVESIIDC